MTPVTLSRPEARRLALSGQGLGRGGFGRGLDGARTAIARLGYVQIDTISVVERAHHHTLFNRVPGYRREHLDRLVARREVLEYWAHAAAYLPMTDYRFCLPRMRAVAARRRHWFKHDEHLVDDILARVREEGPLTPGDFEDHSSTTGMWQWGPVKRVIEYLFQTGDLLVTRREGFRKVFDLPERVLPPGVDTREPTRDEYAAYLVDRFMRANGIGRRAEFGYLRPGLREAITAALERQLDAGSIRPGTVHGVDGDFLVAADYAERLCARVAGSHARLLSPFDNLVIQRERVRRLFGFDYQLECYVPKARRRHGYFCLPVLWRGRLAARLDAKADRGSATFRLLHLDIEPGVRATGELADALADAVRELAAFNGCDRFETKAVRPRALGEHLRTRLHAG